MLMDVEEMVLSSVNALHGLFKGQVICEGGKRRRLKREGDRVL